jgi:hypothetical protein
MAENEIETLNLVNICGGALVEVFERDLQKVLENIADQNTDADKNRIINIRLTFIPFKDRSGAVVELKSETKLPGIPAQSSTVFIDRQNGKTVAVPKDTKQAQLFGKKEQTENVIALKKEKA